MTELIKSIERSVAYLKDRYPADLPLLVSLQKKLEYLYSRQGREDKTEEARNDKSR